MKVNTLQFNTRKDIFWVALTLISICVCLYIYFITVTVRNIVTEKQLSVQTQTMTERISSKEFDFIAMQNKVTLQYAQSLGFADAKQKTFITPTSVSYISGVGQSGGAI